MLPVVGALAGAAGGTLGVTSTSGVNSPSPSGGDSGFYFAPSYNKPLLDFSNPLVLAAIGFVAWLLLKK